MEISTTMNTYSMPTGRTQCGSALLVVVVLLLLATLMTLFAVNIGALEQRTSGNDIRGKLVQQVADSALTQGAEMILADTTLLNLSTNWGQCTAGDTSFPCGSVPAARRASVYRYVGGTTDVFGDGSVDAMDQRMLPLSHRITTVNNSSLTATDGYAVNYGVGVVLCRLTPAAIGNPATCTTDTSETISVNAITLVAVAAMPGEGARATAMKTFATHSTFALSPNAPPLVASGPIELRGNLQVVTSPNGGGPGVPVSVWSRRPLDAGGTPDTCYADEFFHSGTVSLYPGSADPDDQTLRCDDCDCGANPLTGGHGSTCIGGMDILAAPAGCGTNLPVQPDEFPCDIFAFVFGVQAWRDDVPAPPATPDGFCETRITVGDLENPSQQIGADEAYLAEQADWIVTDLTGFGARFASDPRVIACSAVAGKSGLVWVRTGECGDGMTIGTPAAPVLLVHDGTPSFQGLKLFGVLFVRSTGPGPLDPATGGSAELRMDSGSTIYGSAIVQGEMVKVNGSAAVIHDSKVLGNLVGNLSKPSLIPLPGGWTDAVRY